MIARIWRGAVRREDSDEYVDYLQMNRDEFAELSFWPWASAFALSPCAAKCITERESRSMATT